MTSTGAGQPNSGSRVEYRIDGDDRVVAVNDGWIEFAEGNAGEALQPTRVTGRVLWDFLADATTVHLYQVMCTQIRRSESSMRFRFRCDSPELRRLLEMDMSCSHDGGIDFRVSPVAEQPRARVPLLGVSAPAGSDRLITMCGWCKRVRVPDHGWVEIEDGIEALGVFQSPARAAGVTHGICESCESDLHDVPNRLVTLGPLPDPGGWG